MTGHRPAPGYPPRAVPAATCARQLPAQPLSRGPASAVVHALDGGRPLCRARVRGLAPWGGEPGRLCSLCAAALAERSGRLGRFWAPSRAELGDLHLHAAHQLLAATAEAIADIRSAAIADGSALALLEHFPAWRAANGIGDDEPLPPLRATRILGELLDQATPGPLLPGPADRQAAGRSVARIDAQRQALTDRLTAATAARRDDLRAARAGRAR